jgi:large subunit ribosomal protein L14|tara:strand:- start:229 stop:615 length:387 start_codon:yes stop_codon:yes gene_type:complete
MIQVGTKLRVADNSGAKIVECIRVLGGSGKKIGTIGDVIVVSVKELRSYTGGTMKMKIKKGDVSKAVVLRTAKEFSRKDGSFIRFQDNAVILLNAQKQPLGTRIFGPVLDELRLLKNMKLVSMASSLL